MFPPPPPPEPKGATHSLAGEREGVGDPIWTTGETALHSVYSAVYLHVLYPQVVVQTYIHMLEVREEARNGGKGMEQNTQHVSYKERRRKNKVSDH
jgi:hypothetical protein